MFPDHFILTSKSYHIYDSVISTEIILNKSKFQFKIL